MFKKTDKSLNKAALYSAAIQDHLIKKSNMNLDQGFGFKIPKYNNRPKQKQVSLVAIERRKSVNPISSKSILPYESDHVKRLKNQYDETMRNNEYKKKLTLAQRLGIISAPPPPLTAAEWDRIQQMSKNRKDSQNMCSICLEDFKLNPQTILSCSHVFHLNCLTSFEKHNKLKACPICRRKDYQKKVIDQGIRIFTVKSIFKIQKCLRGSQCRRKLYQSLIQQAYKASSKLFSRRLISYKMQRFSIKMYLQTKRKQHNIQKLFDKVEQLTKQTNEEILDRIVEYQRSKVKNKQELDQYLGSNKTYQQTKQQMDIAQNKIWDEAKSKAEKRKDTTCSICLMELGNRPTYLLSCSHTFHVNCINSFERYSMSNITCPCCRQQYQKVLYHSK